MTQETDNKIKDLQMIEQNTQQYVMQKQQFQTQLVEIDSAIKELKQTDISYKIVGNIMVKTNINDQLEDLKKKKEMFELRIKTLEKQEEKLKNKAKEIQKEVLGDMKNDGK
jgi:prefoldin beta subunit